LARGSFRLFQGQIQPLAAVAGCALRKKARWAGSGKVALTPAQLSMLLEGIDWRNPQHSWRPASAG
jgi:transposase